MEKREIDRLSVTGFPMEPPKMQISKPEQTVYPAAETESEFCCDTQTWD